MALLVCGEARRALTTTEIPTEPFMRFVERKSTKLPVDSQQPVYPLF